MVQRRELSVVIIPGDIVDGVLVNAVGSLAGMAMRPRVSRRTARELDIAGWADTEALIKDGLPDVTLELPGLTEEDARSVEEALRADEVQAALQALLAARLTGAPEMEAARAREAVRFSLTLREEHDPGEARREQDGPELVPYARELSDYYDRKICDLVGHLEGSVGLAGLTQVRDEAFSGRIVALLGTIADMVTALRHPDRSGRAEADFLDRYARQARERHGKLQPPDFERRRRIAVDKIYVNTDVHPDASTDARPDVSQGARVSPHDFPMKVMDLAERLDRTVLLGDPGGGKTTAANVLANHFASSPEQLVPFVITLREYAAADPPERSVVGHIEHCLKTLYQCPAPDGLIERLLLTGRAIVIFDGLDELLDTSRRRDVSEQVEQFCAAYPLAPVLVTSRLVGYRQAMLDPEQFTCYRLGDFGDDEVAEYARKWFALQEGNSPAEAEAEAEAFVAESLHAEDVRSNPLLLSLMCILYRGAGSLPRDRPAIYAKCAELLLGRWDESRRIHRELRAGHLVETVIQHLAWWLFTSDNPRAAVTEHQLVSQTTAFLHERAFESEEEARAAAVEFTEFLRGRMWVLSDVGTTAGGEKLYAFTHRTFLEYFAAAHLAAASDTPEALVAKLSPHIMDGGWRMVATLAVQIKSRTSDLGADRFYAAALESMQSGHSDPNPQERVATAKFLTKCIDVVVLSPGTIRRLVRAILDGGFNVFAEAFQELFLVHGQHTTVIADEMARHIADRTESDDPVIRIPALRLVSAPFFFRDGPLATALTWRDWSREQTSLYADQIVADAAKDLALRNIALYSRSLSLADALQMPGGLSALLEETQGGLFIFPILEPYIAGLCDFAQILDYIDEYGVIARYLMNNPDMPWVRIHQYPSLAWGGYRASHPSWPREFDETAAFGLAALRCIMSEIRHTPRFPVDIQVPQQFQQLFRDWSEGTVNFTEIVEDE